MPVSAQSILNQLVIMTVINECSNYMNMLFDEFGVDVKSHPSSGSLALPENWHQFTRTMSSKKEMREILMKMMKRNAVTFYSGYEW